MGTVVGALAGLGYGLCWRVLDAQHFAVPQRRERLFFAGCLGDRAAPVQVLLEPESRQRHPAPRAAPPQVVAGPLGSRAGGGCATELDGHGAYLAGTLGGGSGQRGWCDDYERMTFLPVAYAPPSHHGRNQHETTAVRRLTPRECERLQGFPDDWTRQIASGAVQSDSARYRELGNAVPVPVAEWAARRLAAVHHADTRQGEADAA
jgi:DNA (cytosine-5)-methyltransferase 1